MKLSPKQKEVIKEMREGHELLLNIHGDFILKHWSGCCQGVRFKTACALQDSKVIYDTDKLSRGNSTIYKLTKLGKTIEL